MDGTILCIVLAVISNLFSKQLCVFILTANSSLSIRFGSIYILLTIPVYFANLYSLRISHLLRAYGYHGAILSSSVLTLVSKLVFLYPLTYFSIYLLPVSDILSRFTGWIYLYVKERKINVETIHDLEK